MRVHDGYRPAARHAARLRISTETWATATMIAWSMGILATLLSVAVFGALANPLWLVALGFYLVGIWTLPRAWRHG